MDTILEIIIEVAGSVLEVATEKSAQKHGKLKAILLLLGLVVILIGTIVLGVRWVSAGSIIPAIIVFALDALILMLFLLAAFRKNP